MVGEDALQDSGGHFCPSCGGRNELAANFCAGCGAALMPGGEVAPSHPSSTQEVHLEFVGTGLQALGWGLLATLLGILIRDSPDQTTFPGYSSRGDTAKYNPAFQGRQMRSDAA